MIDALIQKAKQQYGCVFFDGATPEEITQTDEFLQSMEFAPLPQDFISFLQICDGFYYDGLEFLGTKAHPRPQKEYTFMGLQEVNKDFADFEFFSNKIIIGRASEVFIIYDGNNKNYAIIDGVNLCPQIELSGFNNLFVEAMRLCDLVV
ncbi:MAG: SMI1/KNR4 family protein [Alphaproteobacteria bacterium]|nr:SMI1/KNR4 family protein [Alphaproteobacteria bacterium]